MIPAARAAALVFLLPCAVGCGENKFVGTWRSDRDAMRAETRRLFAEMDQASDPSQAIPAHVSDAFADAMAISLTLEAGDRAVWTFPDADQLGALLPMLIAGTPAPSLPQRTVPGSWERTGPHTISVTGEDGPEELTFLSDGRLMLTKDLGGKTMTVFFIKAAGG
jgi:hypothetical protein